MSKNCVNHQRGSTGPKDPPKIRPCKAPTLNFLSPRCFVQRCEFVKSFKATGAGLFLRPSSLKEVDPLTSWLNHRFASSWPSPITVAPRGLLEMRKQNLSAHVHGAHVPHFRLHNVSSCRCVVPKRDTRGDFIDKR